MWCSEPKQIKHSKVKRACDWCYELIMVGEPKKTYFCGGEAIQVNMHPECFYAMMHWVENNNSEELPPSGTFRRGCHCGEREEYCGCEQINDSKVDCALFPCTSPFYSECEHRRCELTPKSRLCGNEAYKSNTIRKRGRK